LGRTSIRDRSALMATDDYTEREMRLIGERDAALTRAELAEAEATRLRELVSRACSIATTHRAEDPRDAAKPDDACPGEGKCHGCLSWCDRCGDVSRICDALRCDKHRCKECNEIRPPATREFWDYVCDICDPPEVKPSRTACTVCGA